MDNFDYPAIGQRIKQLRKRKGLNQTELAQMLKKSLRTVQKYETGEIEVSIAVVNQIADLLDTTSTYILGYESSTTQIRTLADVMDFLFKLDSLEIILQCKVQNRTLMDFIAPQPLPYADMVGKLRYQK